MAYSKNVTRKELLKQPDEFISTTGKLIRLAQTHRDRIARVLAVLLVLVLAVAGWRYWDHRRELAASTLFDQAVARYEGHLKAKGLAGARQAAEKEFIALVQDYPATSGGKLARLVYADVCYAAGDAAKAAELYGQALSGFADQPFYQSLIGMGLGHARLKQKDMGAAAILFEKASTATALADEALFNLGLIYGQQGDNEKSRGCLNRLITEYPTSIYAPIAREKG